MKKAIIYARQSSGSESASESIDVQIRNCTELAEKMHLELIGVFFDHNVSGKTYPSGCGAVAEQDQAFLNWFASQSGHKKFRDGLGEMLKKLPVADFLIVDEMTRLYRPLSNSFLESFINQKLIVSQVQILQVKGGILDLSLFDQHLITMLKNQINDEQIAKQRQKSIEVMAKIRDSGFLPTGPKAWGLDYNKKSKKIAMSTANAELIRFIFKSISENVPYNQIICEVNKKFSHLLKKTFWMSLFYSIARNPIYCGYQLNSDGGLIKNKQWDGVISYDLFETVQKIMQKKRIFENKHHKTAKTGRFMPLSGYIFCGNCGSRLIAGINQDKVYYRCPNAYLHKDTVCAQNRIAESMNEYFVVGLKEAVYSFFKFFLDAEAANCKKQTLHTNKQNINTLLDDCLQQRNFFTHAFIRGELPLSEYNRYSKILNGKIRDLKNCEENFIINNSISVNDLYKKYANKKINNAEYIYLLQNTLNSITVFQEKVVFDTKFGIFERKRKTYKRKKGVSKRYIASV